MKEEKGFVLILLNTTISEAVFLENVRVPGGKNIIIRNSLSKGETTWNNEMFFHKMSNGSIHPLGPVESLKHMEELLSTLLYINLGESPPLLDFLTCYYLCKEKYFVVLHEDYFRPSMLHCIKRHVPIKVDLVKCKTLADVRNVIIN